MEFTALHRRLGRQPGPLTADMIDAISQRLRKTDDVDWKSKLPEPKNLNDSDFPKNVAAMANKAGGVIVFGVTEKEKVATGRVDIGEVTETYERRNPR